MILLKVYQDTLCQNFQYISNKYTKASMELTLWTDILLHILEAFCKNSVKTEKFTGHFVAEIVDGDMSQYCTCASLWYCLGGSRGSILDFWPICGRFGSHPCQGDVLSISSFPPCAAQLDMNWDVERAVKPHSFNHLMLSWKFPKICKCTNDLVINGLWPCAHLV
jgi:hypothetical protein